MSWFYPFAYLVGLKPWEEMRPGQAGWDILIRAFATKTRHFQNSMNQPPLPRDYTAEPWGESRDVAFE